MRALKVGLTGGIGAGKTETLRAFARAGAAVLSLDEVSRRPEVRKAQERLFGTTDRAAIARRVFEDAAARKRLERATHPLILREMRRWLRSQKGVAVVEVPLLFEVRAEKDFDVTLAVISRRKGDPKRARAQWPPEKKAERADVVIRNDGTLNDLRRTVKEYQAAFTLIAGGRNG